MSSVSSVSSLSPEVRNRAQRIWWQRWGAELEAAARFQRLASALHQSGASAGVVAMAHRAASDELRHAELCRALVVHLGGEAKQPAEPSRASVAPHHLAADERTLYEVVAMACVTETLSTALLGALVERATDPLVRQSLQSILKDEVEHSRLGWAYLAEASQRSNWRDGIGPWLPPMLNATLTSELFVKDPDPSEVGLAALGSLERAERRAVVCETLQRVVFPGLERFGVETATGRSWLATRIQATST